MRAECRIPCGMARVEAIASTARRRVAGRILVLQILGQLDSPIESAIARANWYCGGATGLSSMW